MPSPALVTTLLILSLGSLLLLAGWLLARREYFRRVVTARQQIQHSEKQQIPWRPPRFLVGNLLDIYQAPNRLSAYHQFHESLGEMVQIFWMWRSQLSIANFPMVHHILVTHQKNYRKFPPNRLLQQLYGASVLTNHGASWQRQRSLVQGIFSAQRVAAFHPIFVACTEQLVAQWLVRIQSAGGSVRHDVYPDLGALFLDIIGQSAFGISMDQLQGKNDRLLPSIQLILKQSTHPLYQFISWWQSLPLPSNRRLNQAFSTIDQFLYGLIKQRRKALQQGEAYRSSNLLDLLLQATEQAEHGLPPLTDREVRDNLLAILVNGYETVATSVALTLDLLAHHPEDLSRAQREIDQVFATNGLSATSIEHLRYLRAVIVESLRLCPPMAGLQRISLQPDRLCQWSIPAAQVVGIPLRPLHLNTRYYGAQPEQFCPRRYLEEAPPSNRAVAKNELAKNELAKNEADWPQSTGRGCPLKRFLGASHNLPSLPLTFGEGARRCLGETFALHEMTVVLSILLHRFSLAVASGDRAEMELGKFGLFISMVPKSGVYLMLRDRTSAP